MRIYVAGRTSQIEIVNKIQERAIERGHEISHDWTGSEGGIASDWSSDRDRANEVAHKDFHGVASADAVIMCGWGCGEGEGGLGCFIEAGIALCNQIPIVIIGPMRESVFWYLDQVTRHTGTNSLDREIDWAIFKAEGEASRAI